MVRTGLLLTLAAALAVAAPASSADQRRIASYCSQSGDVCYGIFKNDQGAIRFQLTTAARYFAHYRICVRRTGSQATCRSFPVRRRGASYGGSVIWLRNFPSRSPGAYQVTWKRGSQRLGPSLTFRLPAPV